MSDISIIRVSEQPVIEVTVEAISIGPKGDAGPAGAAGAAGSAGPAGSDGSSVLSGTAAPTTEGVDGDFYIRTTTWHIYGPKDSGVWPAGTPMITGSVTDGDKGDITATSGGTVWTIDNGVVTPIKLGTGTIENSGIVIDCGLI